MKITKLCLLLSFVLFPSCTLDSNAGLIYISNGDGTCEVKQGDTTKLKSEIVIPSKSPEGDTVTSIAEFGFSSQDIIKKITLPDTLKTIGKFGFFDSKIEEITTPSSLEIISDCAFFACTELKSFSFVDGLKSIGKEAFFYCPKFDGKLDLPDSITFLGDQAFARSSDIVNIHIPNSLTELPEKLFNGTDMNTTLIIPGSIKKIHFDDFGTCNIDTLICSSGVERIYENYSLIDDIREVCSTHIKKIYIPASVEKLSYIFDGSSTKIYCEAPYLPESWDSSWARYEDKVIWNASIDDID